MIKRMVPRAGVALTTALILSACGGGGGGGVTGPSPGESTQTALDYSYPLNQQTEVPTPAPVVLEFSNSIAGTDVASSITLHQGDDASGATVAVTTKTANNGKSLVLTPDQKLAPHSDYAVVIAGSSTVKDRVIGFSTRALQEGPKSEVVSADSMKLMGMFPNGSSNEPMMDFSTLRLRFSQPLDRSTVSYGNGQGDTVALLDDQSNVVPAHMIVDGPYLTIDPSQNLTPGEHYTLHFESNQVKSTYGQAFYYVDNSTYQLTPKSSLAEGQNESQRPQPLVQKLTENGNSALTGDPINQIPVSATLLGNNNNIQQSGNVLGDLAFLPRYPTISPLSIRRGTLLKGASIAVNIGGKVYAGFDTGEVDVRFLSDASGYLMPNPYNDSPNAPRLVKLYMDVAISAENATANAGVTQNITHLELIGTAQTDTKLGVVNINAVGVVTPEILGLERGYGTLSFQLQSYPDQTSAPTVAKDTTPPTLQSWMPGDNENLQSPDDPITLNFDEPLDSTSLKKPGALSLTEDGSQVNFQYKLDGSSLVIQPEGGLHYSPATNNPQYILQVGSQITDLAGNGIVPKTLTFALPALTTIREVPLKNPDSAGPAYTEQSAQVNSPVLLSSYPGYPCVTDASTRDLANGYVGRCAGGPGNWPDDQIDSQGEQYIDAYHPDDDLPLMAMPANQPIVLQFSKELDADSVRLGGSFRVVSLNADETNATAVPGRLSVQGRKIVFYPDQPWSEGQIYRYTLGSNNDTNPSDIYSGYIGSSDAVCDGTQSICGKDGYPLQTQPLGILSHGDLNLGFFTGGRLVASHTVETKSFAANAGGPDLVIFFKGAKQDSGVVQTLRGMPDSDVNGNLIHEQDLTVHGVYPTGVLETPDFYNTVQTVTAGNTYFGPWPMIKYDHQEAGPTTPNPNADPDLDPDGLLGIPNSAKILSKNVQGIADPWAFRGANDSWKTNFYSNISVDGANIGCGYDGVFDMNTGEPIDSPEQSDGVVRGGKPAICPKQKFSYIKMALNATVTDEYVQGKGVKVLIWPATVMTSSFSVYARSPIQGYSSIAVPSGPQIMRMRYAKDDPNCVDTQDNNCARSKPITGWITEGPNGNPILQSTVHLYLDSPLIDTELSVLGLNHNLHSYPVTMDLRGPVTFLDDGRMVIKQYNNNDINIDYKIYTNRGGYAWGRVPLELPANGVFIQMESSPIKDIE